MSRFHTTYNHLHGMLVVLINYTMWDTNVWDQVLYLFVHHLDYRLWLYKWTISSIFPGYCIMVSLCLDLNPSAKHWECTSYLQSHRISSPFPFLLWSFSGLVLLDFLGGASPIDTLWSPNSLSAQEKIYKQWRRNLHLKHPCFLYKQSNGGFLNGGSWNPFPPFQCFYTSPNQMD